MPVLISGPSMKWMRTLAHWVSKNIRMMFPDLMVSTPFTRVLHNVTSYRSTPCRTGRGSKAYPALYAPHDAIFWNC